MFVYSIESYRYSACSSNYLSSFPNCRVSSIIRLAQKRLAFPGDLSGTSAGNFDILVMKLDDTGSQQWTYQTGTASADYAFAVETDASGNILLAGSTDGSMQGSNAGDSDILWCSWTVRGHINGLFKLAATWRMSPRHSALMLLGTWF